MAARAEALEFAHRVLRCGVLRGLEAAAFWASPGVLWIQVRHPYGPWKTVRLTGISGGLAKSESGNPVCASDVAVRLKGALKDRRPDQRIGNAWKVERMAMEARRRAEAEVDFVKLLADSSLGTPEALAMRAEAPRDVVERVLERVDELDEKE